jgi:ABC-type nitrate/sulfonate/bicarbonate transport system permease component
VGDGEDVTRLRWYMRWARGLLASLAFVVAWGWLAELRWVPRVFLPSPLEVAQGFVEILGTGVLVRHVRDSLVRFALFYLTGSGAGLVAGLAMGVLPPVARFMRPLVGFFNAIAGVAWLPLAMLWFGAAEPTVGFVTVNGVFFVVAINTLAGVQAVPRLYEQGLLVLGATPLQVIHQVLLPGALPAMLSGLRLAMGFGWRALVASEMVAAASGLGYLVYRASYDFRYDVVWAGILLLGLLSVSVDGLLFAPLEKRTVRRWGMIQSQ